MKRFLSLLLLTALVVTATVLARPTPTRTIKPSWNSFTASANAA